MLAIRMQRLGRKGHPTYRVVVQDVKQTPTSGKFVAMLGSYDPHAKTSTLVKEKAQFYLDNGAQPSERVVSLFKAEGLTLPSWVKTEQAAKTRKLRNPDKLRKNQPPQEAAPVEAEAEVEPPAEDAPAAEVAEVEAEATTEEAPAEEAK